MLCSSLARLLVGLGCSALALSPLPAAEPHGPGVPTTEPLAVEGRREAAVFVPSLWDPGRLPERPPLADIPTIRFVTVDDYPPFGFSLPDGTLTGFNVDLARALCAALDLSCTVQVRRFDTIGSALRAGTADAAIASMSVTASVDVDFTAPYYKTPARFFARVGATPDPVLPETVGRRTIGVLRGTAHEAFLRAAFPEAGLHSFDSTAGLRTALRTGAVDLAFGDGIGWVSWLADPDAQGCCAAVEGAYTESRYFGEGAGIAVRKGNDTLRRALDYALARVAADGRYGELYLKYFPIGIY